MKRLAVLFISIAMVVSGVVLMTVKGHASDYQGEENRGSVFQVLGDLVTGNYKVDGKPIKEKGWFQVSADQTKKMELSSVDKPADKSKNAKP